MAAAEVQADDGNVVEQPPASPTYSDASNSSFSAPQLIDPELMTLINSVQKCPLPDLKSFEEPKPLSESHFEVGLGDDNLVHSIMISDYLRQAATGRATAMPKLVIKSHGEFRPIANLTSESVQELLKRAIVLICVYNGFDITSESILQTLVDVCGDFISSICKLLKAKIDTQDIRSGEDFSIEAAHVFAEANMPLQLLQQHIQSIGQRKERLLREVHSKHGIRIDIIDEHPARPAADEEPLAAPIPYRDLIVGLDDASDSSQQDGKAESEKILDELGVSMDMSNGELIDFGS